MVKAFVWDHRFLTGLERVDEQHHRLVDLINRLGQLLAESNSVDEAEVGTVFGQLTDYAQYHFTEEEGLMQESGIAAQHLEHHHEQHQEMVDQLQAIWAGRGALSNPGEALHSFMRAWLVYHVLGQDMDMASQIRHIRAGESAQQALQSSRKPVDEGTAILIDALHNVYRVVSEQNRALDRASTSLRERIKELGCMYGVSRLAARADKSVPVMLGEAVQLLPPAWFYPAITCARITYGGRSYTTDNFVETSWHLHGQASGAASGKLGVDVYYLEERPTLDQGPFMKEEVELVNELARILSVEIERRHMEEAARQQNAELMLINTAVVDRELTMIGLKEEVNTLSQQLGMKPPYDLTFAGAPTEGAV